MNDVIYDDAQPDTGPAPIGTTGAVAGAIMALTYGDLMVIGSELRDIISDRMADGEELDKDVLSVMSMLHDWAEGHAAD